MQQATNSALDWLNSDSTKQQVSQCCNAILTPF